MRQTMIGDAIWRACAILFGVAALVGVLNGCTQATPQERANAACMTATATLTAAERLQAEDPTPERARRIAIYQTAAETACAYAASLNTD